EQEVNGVENMIYMSSRCTNDGQMILDVTFELGTNLDMAQVLVQNRVKIAEAKLPEDVKRQGVTTKKKSPSILLCVNVISTKETDPVTQQERFKFDQLYLSNYATIYVKDDLARVTGVGDVSFLGPRDYSMRVWLDPKKLAARSMTAGDVLKGIREQNVQVAAGRLGQPPTPAGQNFQLTLNTLGRLETEDQFRAIVVLVFLQNWRATLIPMVAVPVSLIGTFAVMALLGFSLNNLSLFGLVLAIGIVVDDAIVVVENVERHMGMGKSPRDAARAAMIEVTGPVIAIALVLCAVFVPTSFMAGISGQFYKQFALTIAVSTVISAFNSLTLSPALCALLLKPHGAGRDPLTKGLDFALGWFFRGFNRGFDATSKGYSGVVRLLV